MSCSSVGLLALILQTVLVLAIGPTEFTDASNPKTHLIDDNSEVYPSTSVPPSLDHKIDIEYRTSASANDILRATESDGSPVNNANDIIKGDLLVKEIKPTLNEHASANDKIVGTRWTSSYREQPSNPEVISDSQNDVGAIHRLHSDLFRSYNKLIKPRRNQDETVDVSIRIHLYQIRKLNEREQVLTSLFWMFLFWTDEYLSWNPVDYNGTAHIFVDSDLIWKPDICLMNSGDEDNLTPTKLLKKVEILVSHAGFIFYCVPVLAQTVCEMTIAKYPFDSHRCGLFFSTWQTDITYVNFTLDTRPVDFTKYVNHSEWDLENITYNYQGVEYPCCPGSFYPEVTFSFLIRRKLLYVLFHLLLPPLLLDVIGFLTFLVPPDSGERISLSISLLLALSVFQMIVMESVPASSDSLPVASLFLGGSILLLAFVTGVSVIIVYLKHQTGRNGGQPPNWLYKLSCDLLGPYLGVPFTPDEAGQKEQSLDTADIYLQHNNSKMSEDAISQSCKAVEREVSSDVISSSAILMEILLELNMLREETTRRMLPANISFQGQQDDVTGGEWDYHARVLNRLFMLIYVCGIVALFIALIINLYL